MPGPRHLAFPLALSSTGSLATVEQGSAEDVAGCIDVIVSYPRGARRGSPSFGLPPVAFEQGGPSLNAVRGAVQTSEPRASYDVELTDPFLLGAIARVRLGFDVKRPA